MDQSLISVLPTSFPQEPGLDPKPILELPLVELAQKLQAEELSLESVLCSYLEQVGVRGQGQDLNLPLGWSGDGGRGCGD